MPPYICASPTKVPARRRADWRRTRCGRVWSGRPSPWPPTADVESVVEMMSGRTAAGSVASAGGEQAEGRDIGREIKRAGGERRLQCLRPLLQRSSRPRRRCRRVRRDIGQGNGSTTTLARAFSAKRPKPRRPASSVPSSAARAQRERVDRHRAFHHHAGTVGDGTVERQFQRRAGQPRLQAGAVARQRSDEVAGADRAVDALAAPVECPVPRTTARSRPGQRQVDIAEHSETWLVRPRN